jgi:hypothetical protein
MASVLKKWQIFGSSTDLGLTKMLFKSSNVKGTKTEEEGLRKYGLRNTKMSAAQCHAKKL